MEYVRITIIFILDVEVGLCHLLGRAANLSLKKKKYY